MDLGIASTIRWLLGVDEEIERLQTKFNEQIAQSKTECDAKITEVSNRESQLAQSGDLANLAALLNITAEKLANFTDKVEPKHTPLLTAPFWNYTEVVAAKLKAGYNKDGQFGLAAMASAIEAQNVELVKFLCDVGVRVDTPLATSDVPHDSYPTAFGYAISTQSVAVVKQITKCSGFVPSFNILGMSNHPNGMKPDMAPTIKFYSPILALLKDGVIASSFVHYRNEGDSMSGLDLVHTAVLIGHVDMIDTLHKQGVDFRGSYWLKETASPPPYMPVSSIEIAAKLVDLGAVADGEVFNKLNRCELLGERGVSIKEEFCQHKAFFVYPNPNHHQPLPMLGLAEFYYIAQELQAAHAEAVANAAIDASANVVHEKIRLVGQVDQHV